MTRSFNHIGPGQRPQFVVASFVKQLVEASKQGGDALLKVGNIEVIRDFSDVRDVVRAYWDILTKGKPGEAYNVCSGKGTRLSDLIQIIATELKLNVTTKVDPALVRPVDAPAVIGSHDKITNELGWEPQIPLNQTIRDMIAALQ
jgi:GDP-4-dehydro-6-deoxy-D-mannose reductase